MSRLNPLEGLLAYTAQCLGLPPDKVQLRKLTESIEKFIEEPTAAHVCCAEWNDDQFVGWLASEDFERSFFQRTCWSGCQATNVDLFVIVYLKYLFVFVINYCCLFYVYSLCIIFVDKETVSRPEWFTISGRKKKYKLTNTHLQFCMRKVLILRNTFSRPSWSVRIVSYDFGGRAYGSIWHTISCVMELLMCHRPKYLINPSCRCYVGGV